MKVMLLNRTGFQVENHLISSCGSLEVMFSLLALKVKIGTEAMYQTIGVIVAMRAPKLLLQEMQKLILIYFPLFFLDIHVDILGIRGENIGPAVKNVKY